MKLKKVLLQIGLLLAFAGVGVMGTLAAQAASIPSNASKLAVGSGTGIMNQSGQFVDSDKGGAKGFGSSLYPTLGDVYADGVSGGRVTKQTKNIYINYSDVATMSVRKKGSYVSAHADVMTYQDGVVKSLSTNTPASWRISSDSTTSTATPVALTVIPVDFSNLGTDPVFPIFIGFSYRATGFTDTEDVYYWQMELTGDNTIINNMKEVTINDGNDMASASTVVKGTGEPGLTATLSGVSGSGGQYSATIKSDGTYSIDLGGSSLKDLGNPATIKVTESNDFGDSKSATADVKDSVPLTTTAASSSVAVDPDTLSGNVTGKSDAEILAWLSGQSAAGLTTVKEGSTTALTDADGLTYTADTTELASKIATATAADPLTINVSASDSAGDKTTATTPIKIYTTDGTFKFNSLSDFAFGTLPVPAQETLFAPTNTPSILIDDTQTVGKDWYVTANATKMTDSASNELNGDMVYVDADGAKHNLTNTTTLVGQGQRESGKTTAEVADGWANAGTTVAASKFTDGVATGVTKGVYLDAHPNIYTGGVADGNAYTGAINWTLTNSVSGS